MQIVINISEETYKAVCNRCMLPPDVESVVQGIKDGTPLPKGHGDLKDSDDLIHAFVMWSMAVQGNFTDADIASIVRNSQTIIEADKAESEDNNAK